MAAISIWIHQLWRTIVSYDWKTLLRWCCRFTMFLFSAVPSIHNELTPFPYTKIVCVVTLHLKPVISVTDNFSHGRSRPASHKVTLNREGVKWLWLSSHSGTDCARMIVQAVSGFWETSEQGGNQEAKHTGQNNKPRLTAFYTQTYSVSVYMQVQKWINEMERCCVPLYISS